MKQQTGSSKQNAKKKSQKRGLSKPWQVWCKTDGLLGSFETRSEAIDIKKQHIDGTGHNVKIIGTQTIKKLLFSQAE